VPRESGWFEFFAPHTQSEASVVPLKQSAAYTQDLLGLRTLDAQGKLQLVSCDCRHQDYPAEACHDLFNKYTLPRLQTTV
jgi:hypothetical protein